MEHPIVEKIMKDGINSVNISMLDDASRKRILTDAGEKLYKQGKFREAIEIISKNSDTQRLQSMGDSFLQEGKTELAALCFIPTKDKQRLNEVAVFLIKSKNYKMASDVYRAADNEQMASFIRENFNG